MRMFKEKKIPNLDGFLDLVWVNDNMLTAYLWNIFLGVFLDLVRVDSGWGLGCQYVFWNIQFAVLGVYIYICMIFLCFFYVSVDLVWVDSGWGYVANMFSLMIS